MDPQGLVSLLAIAASLDVLGEDGLDGQEGQMLTQLRGDRARINAKAAR